jgi:hypothetical protein
MLKTSIVGWNGTSNLIRSVQLQQEHGMPSCKFSGHLQEVQLSEGGTSSQFLKADGSIDDNDYITEIIEFNDQFTATVSQSRFT